MPPRWPRVPDRNDPKYRRLDDRMTLATHIALFAASNSGLWFFNNFGHLAWGWLPGISLGWLAALAFHVVYVLAIADYSE
jgi:hypothetical protein